jgi:hypothetical protein
MPLSLMRAVVATSLGLAAVIFLFPAAAGATGSPFAATVIAAFGAAWIAWLVATHRIVALDEAACSRSLKIVATVATLAALLVLTRLAVFMIDPSRAAYSLVPSSRWEVEHNCLTAYYVSSQAASTTQDIYDDALFTSLDDVPTKPRKPLMLGPFKIDVFEYPPPFLLLPRGLLRLAHDFTRLRMLWFGLSGGVVLAAVLAVVRFMGPAAGTRALLLSPLMWLSLPMLSCLQKGNVQVLVIAASMLAMVLIERGSEATGGAVLAFMAMSKIYPGMLVIFLLAQRRWRALAFTAGAGIVFLAVSLVDTGWAPYASFLRRLPQILGGEAFPAFRNPAAVAVNFSIPGLVFKLKQFGVPGMTFAVSKLVGWAYTLVVVAFTVLAARRTLDKDRLPAVWMAILILATMRAPFLPVAYAAIPPLWLLTLMAATVAPSGRVVTMVGVLWAVLNIYWPTDWTVDPRLVGGVVLVPAAASLGLAMMALRSARGDRRVSRVAHGGFSP